MYLLSMHYENAKKNDVGRFHFERKRGKIPKWTLLPSGPAGRELLQLMALSCGGPGFLAHLPCNLRRFCRISDTLLHLEILMVRHLPYDGMSPKSQIFGSGIEINNRGQVKAIKINDRRMLSSGISINKLRLPDNPKKVVGYYSLSTLSIELNQLPEKLARKLPKHPVPAALIGRLAVSKTAQGHGIGKMLLADAIKRTLSVSVQIAIYAMVVDAIDGKAKDFYKQFGFTRLSDDSPRLFLPLKSIE